MVLLFVSDIKPSMNDVKYKIKMTNFFDKFETTKKDL